MALVPFNLVNFVPGITVYLCNTSNEPVRTVTLDEYEAEEKVIVFSVNEEEGIGYILFYFDPSSGREITSDDADGTELHIMFNYVAKTYTDTKRFKTMRAAERSLANMRKLYNIQSATFGHDAEQRMDEKQFTLKYTFTSKLFD